MQIKRFTGENATQWDDYVGNHPKATFFHKAGWKTVFEQAFDHTTHYLYAEDNNLIRGILPLVEVKSFLFGHHLISTPFCVYGGPIADAIQIRDRLASHACDLASSLGVDDLEFRSIEKTQTSWPVKELYVTFRKQIEPVPEDILSSIPRKQRAMVRKGIKENLTSETSNDIDRFYRTYSQSVRNLGTPVFGKRYLELLANTFREDVDVFMVSKQGQDVAGVMSFYFRNEILPYYAGSIPMARQLKANDYMYWQLMCQAAARGIEIFDYGRSKTGTGSYSFKKNWGFSPTPLNYEFHLVGATELPRVDPMNPKYQRLIEIWKRLPLKVANFIGPFLAKNLG